MKELAQIRNDVIGSLLRPAKLKEARLRYDDGRITIKQLREVEDQSIRDAVKLQEEIGLSVVTDGEYRRLNFQDSFGESVEDLKRRIDDAGKHVPVDQIAISPQCGFSSDIVGNLIGEDDQKRKLEVVVETAR